MTMECIIHISLLAKFIFANFHPRFTLQEILSYRRQTARRLCAIWRGWLTP